MNKYKYLDLDKVRNSFPQLNSKFKNKMICYFDNGASTLKPNIVLNKINEIYQCYYSNVHRGNSYLTEKITKEYENVRYLIKDLINIENQDEIIFTKGTTDSINLVANAFSDTYIKEKDEIILSEMEHHSNLIPWQNIANKYKVKIRFIPINKKGELIISEYIKLLSFKVKVVAVSHISNLLGSINPIKSITRLAHNYNAKVLIDGAQAISHIKINMLAINCDFYAFSGHKMYGPTGVGVLYCKSSLLNAMKPYQGGGDMISLVTKKNSTYASIPHKFEAGTPNIIGVIGLGESILFLKKIGLNIVAYYENILYEKIKDKIKTKTDVSIIGEAKRKVPTFSFRVKSIHAHDLNAFLDKDGIILRSGHMCTQLVLKKYSIFSVCRISLSFYNNIEEIDKYLKSMNTVKELFNG